MNTVGILGTIHKFHLNEDFNYPLDHLGELIKQFNPDIICGEVRPEDFDEYCKDKTYSEYLGPMEYRELIIPFCEKNNIEFIPVDWFEFDLIEDTFVDELSAEEESNMNNELDCKFTQILDVGKNSNLPFNSFEFDKLIISKNEWINTLKPIFWNVTWIARNQIMLERIKKTLRQHKDKRILCIVGAEHNYFYYNELQKLDINIIYPLI